MGVQGRITGLPLYEDEGRHLLHLGISGGWRNGTNSPADRARADYVEHAGPPRNERRRSPAAASPTGAAILPEGNGNRMINTGKHLLQPGISAGHRVVVYPRASLVASRVRLELPEQRPASPCTAASATPVRSQNYVFNGGYLQAAYTLTGENRAYDKKSGTLDRYYLGGQGPYENAFLVRDADGGLCCGHGAWEIACRYSYVDLNSGFGRRATLRQWRHHERHQPGPELVSEHQRDRHDRLGLQQSLRYARQPGLNGGTDLEGSTAG